MLRLKNNKSKISKRSISKSSPRSISTKSIKIKKSSKHILKVSIRTNTTTTTPTSTIPTNNNLPSALQPTVAPNNLPPNVDPLSARVTTTPPRQTIFNLMGWVHSNGGKLNPNVFYGSMNILRDKNSTDTGNWRGLALNDIEPGEILAEVPLSLCLFPLERSYNNTTKLQQDGHDESFFTGLQGLLTAIPPQQWQLRLGTRLLAERAAEKSFFQPYIDALPAQYPTFPIFFHQKTAQTLAYQPMLVSLNKQAQRLGTLSKQLTIPKTKINDNGEASIDPNINLNPLQKSSLLVFNSQDVQIGDLAWGECSVSSRAFDCPLPSSKLGIGVDANRTSIDGIDASYSYSKCLVPLIDMLNHSFTPNCAVTFRYDGDKPFDPDDPECRTHVRAVLKSTSKINRGGELTISYFKHNEPDTIPTMPEPITAQNQNIIEQKILESNDITELFKHSLIRVPNVNIDGLQSTVNNDRLLQHFGFIPGFNYKDDVVLNPDPSFFDTALEMSHDITVAHSYLAGKLSTSASQKISLEQQQKQKDQNGPQIPHGITIGTVDNNNNNDATNKDGVPKEITQAMFGEENTYESALVKLLLPLAKQRTDDQSFLLMSIFQHNPTLTINWGGPNDTLLGVCRIIAAGAHTAEPIDTNNNELLNSKTIEQEIIAKQESETKIASSIEHKANQIFIAAEKRARVMYAMEGEFLSEEDELTGAQLFKGFTSGPIDKDNEMGAMLVLYHALVVASAGFRTGINKDVEGFYKAVITGNVGDATAHLYARSKKMLMAHSMKTLATRIGLDSDANKIHNWHKRLDEM